MKLILIRHAETEWNCTGKINGLTDTKITQNGLEQARKTGQYLSNSYKEHLYIYTSSLERARTTSEIINSYLNAFIVVDNRLIERDYGSLEGKNINDINWDKIGSDVEGTLDLLKRVGMFINFLKEHHNDEDNIIIVSHGSILRHLIKLICGFNEYIDLKNCSITCIQMDGIDAICDKDDLNFIGHLS